MKITIHRDSDLFTYFWKYKVMIGGEIIYLRNNRSADVTLDSSNETMECIVTSANLLSTSKNIQVFDGSVINIKGRINNISVIIYLLSFCVSFAASVLLNTKLLFHISILILMIVQIIAVEGRRKNFFYILSEIKP